MLDQLEVEIHAGGRYDDDVAPLDVLDRAARRHVDAVGAAHRAAAKRHGAHPERTAARALVEIVPKRAGTMEYLRRHDGGGGQAVLHQYHGDVQNRLHSRLPLDPEAGVHPPVVGSITRATSLIRLAGKPLSRACSRTASSSSAR